MASKYDSYWQDHLDAVLALFEQASTAGTSSPVSLVGIEALGERSSWQGKLEIVAGKPVYNNAAHLASLGETLTPRLSQLARDTAWIVTVSKDCQLTVQKVEARQTSWFEEAYRVAKHDETLERTSAFLGPLTPDYSGAAMCKDESGRPTYVLFCSQKDHWLTPQRNQLESVAAAEGHLVLSLTEESSGRFDLWIIPAVELVAVIQRAGYMPSIDQSKTYSLNLAVTAATDRLRQLNWDIRPYRRESGHTDLTRATFWPAKGPEPTGDKTVAMKMTTPIDVHERLAQWKVEATDPNHPNHFHASLDTAAAIYARISTLLQKLRTAPASFDRDDVVALFGALNSGQRMKNKVADENPLPELCAALLALLDGEGAPTAKIAAAAGAIRSAGSNMLGELYGWANAEKAPLYNGCAKDALSHLGYSFDPTNYDEFLAAHEQFKQVYLGEVGRLRPELPLNLEIDKFYNVIDKVDLKAVPQSSQLAKPWRTMFGDWGEAQWAFDLLSIAAEALGLSGPDDPLATFTLQDAGSPHELRFSYGKWLVFRIAGRRGALTRITLALFIDQPDIPGRPLGQFAQRPDERPVGLFDFTPSVLRPLPLEVRELYEETLAYIHHLFAHWSRSNWHRANETYLAQAALDPAMCDLLLKQGPPAASAVSSESASGATTDEPSAAEESFEDDPTSLTPLAPKQPTYTLAQCAADTGFSADELAGWVRAIERKGQAVLYGPPGTGKTFVAERLARHLVSDGDGFWDLVQFHPAYAYEDFIQGIRPQSMPGGALAYPMVNGRFLDFCAAAARRQDPCVLIIDEINRANLARVFGELMYLLEYRDREIPLAGGGKLCIPRNVRLIGTMNTADRSIALVDHALRRRFAFLALYPNYSVLRDFHQRENTGYPVEKLIQVLTRLNNAIQDRHYSVGITFFLRPKLAAEIADIWRMEIEPYLDEYFFDQPDKADAFRWEHVQAELQAPSDAQGVA
jgi:hypothetical protein